MTKEDVKLAFKKGKGVDIAAACKAYFGQRFYKPGDFQKEINKNEPEQTVMTPEQIFMS